MGIGVKLAKGSGQVVGAAATWTTVLFSGVEWHRGATFWVAGDPNKITIPAGYGGRYLIAFASYNLSLKYSMARVLKNGTTPILAAGIESNSVNTNRRHVGAVLQTLAAGDYLELQTQSGFETFSIGSGAEGPTLLVHYFGDGPEESVAALVTRVTDFTIGASDIAIPYESAIEDTDSFWSAGDPTKLTIPAGKGGTYIVGGSFSTTRAPGTGLAEGHWFRINGTTQVRCKYGTRNDGEDGTCGLITVLDLAVGEYIETMARDRNVNKDELATDFSPQFWLQRIEDITI